VTSPVVHLPGHATAALWLFAASLVAMSLGAIVLLALGLSMDATAVAAARGAVAKQLRASEVAILAVTIGIFHAAMLALGWLGGTQLGEVAAEWDHWVAFGLLGLIGGRMIVQAFRAQAPATPALSASLIVVLAFATSVDALAVGVTLPLIEAPLIVSLCVIGGVAAAASAIGMVVGHRLGKTLGAPATVIGGLVLLGIGTKILVEHLSA